jgi:uncharacterized phage protein (TIGR02218 family)
MKTISAGLDAHLGRQQTSTAICWRAELTDSTVLGFTSHDRDIVFQGVTYQASSGFAPSAVASNADLAVDNLDMEGVLRSPSITETDLQSGRWDFAKITVLLVNWADLTQGALVQKVGTIGAVRVERGQFVAELRGLAQQVQQDLGQIYSATCRAKFGDTRCGVALGPLTISGTVTSVQSDRQFTDTSLAQAADYFRLGLVSFTSGDNEGKAFEVAAFASGGVVTLEMPAPFVIQVGNTFTISPGCGKRFDEDCKTRWNNAINFRGEPHVSGVDEMVQAGGS